MIRKRHICDLLKSLLVPVLLLVSAPVTREEVKSKDNPFYDKIVRCAIALNDDMYENDGLEAGMSYEVLKDFSRENDCTIEIQVYTGRQSPLDSLLLGKSDFLIIEKEKLQSSTGIISTATLCNSTVWAFPAENSSELLHVNSWLKSYLSTKDFEETRERFMKSYDPRARARSGRKYKELSPYDDIIRKEAVRLGWDWKMLVAVLWQESRFSINSRSYRGAEGLMQVMPSTGRYYDVTNLLDPYENLEAGTKHLNRVQRIFRRYNLTGDELVKFTLGAYNAGEGRILDCMNLAEHLGKDKTSWEDIVSIIPYMNDEDMREAAGVNLGAFHGTETINYVENVFSLYQDFCTISARK